LLRRCEEALHRSIVPHVDLGGEGSFAAQIGGRAFHSVLAQITHRNQRARRVEPPGYAEADAGTGTRDDNDFSLQRLRHDQLLFERMPKVSRTTAAMDFRC